MSRTMARAAAALALVTIASLVAPFRAEAASPGVVISEVYGGGGNTGATLKNDFIELFNRSDDAVDLTGWSVQYTSAAGTRWQVTPLEGTLEAGEHYLIEEAGGAGGTEPLPTPDATGSIALSATSGKVALVTSSERLPCGSACSGAANVVDFLGYGSSANDFEGSGPAGTLSNTEAAQRISDGCVDSDDNAADFTIGSPAPENTAAPAARCSARADLTLEMDSSRDVAETGTRFRYTLRIRNGGPSSATGVTVDDTLPHGLVLEASIPDGACTESGGTVTCGIGTLSPGATASVFLYVAPTIAGEVTNTASASAVEPDPTPASAAVTTSIVGPDCVTIGTPGNDVIEGSEADDVICALGGEDTITAGSGNDWVATGTGHDRARGGEGDDRLHGWSGADALTGGAGADTLLGGEQGDTLYATDGIGGNDTADGAGATDKCYADAGDTLIACP